MRDLKDDIYEWEKTLKRTLEFIQQDKDMLKVNKAVIVSFIDAARSRGLSGNRLTIIAHHLRRIGKLTKANFKAFSEQNAKQLMMFLEATKYGDWTKLTCKKLFKQLMRSLHRPANVFDWVKAEEPPSKLKKEDLLTPDEIRRLIISAPDNMWRALLRLLAEYGCRPGEALNLRVKDVIINGSHIKLYVAGKMAKKQGPRPIFLFKSREAIKAWLAEHPQKDNPDAPL